MIGVLSWPIVERSAWLFAAVGRRRGLRADDQPVEPEHVAQEIAVRAALGAIVVGRLA